MQTSFKPNQYNPFVYHENPSNDLSFTKAGDAWAVHHQLHIYAVADSPLRYLTRQIRSYPYADQGFEAANTFCQNFVNLAEEIINSKKKFSEKDLKSALTVGNEAVGFLNKQLGKKYTDPANYDVAETVGMGAILFEGELFYGGLEDCYVNILRGNQFENIEEIDYQILKAKNYLDKLSASGKLNSFIPEALLDKLNESAIWESCWCNHLRNNPKALDENGSLVGWGCFTGEETAEEFFQVHSSKLEKGDHILIYSDGMIPALADKKFLNWLVHNASSQFDFALQMQKKIRAVLVDDIMLQKEKTLIYFQY